MIRRHARLECLRWYDMALRYARIANDSPRRVEWLRYALYALRWAIALRDGTQAPGR